MSGSGKRKREDGVDDTLLAPLSSAAAVDTSSSSSSTFTSTISSSGAFTAIHPPVTLTVSSVPGLSPYIDNQPPPPSTASTTTSTPFTTDPPTTTTTPTTWQPRHVSLYKKTEKLTLIGEGTYGSVFLARDPTGELVALKKIRKEKKEGFPITAIREIKILKRVDHVNIVRLKDVVSSHSYLPASSGGSGGSGGGGGGGGGGRFKEGDVFMVFEFCFDPATRVWLADGCSKRVDQLLPTDQLLDELGEAISIVPNTLIGTVHFPQPPPGHPLHAAGSLVPTPIQGGYVPPPGTTTVNPGYQQKRRIQGNITGFVDFIVSDNHPLTVGTNAPARLGTAGRTPRALGYCFPADCNWQVGQAPAGMVGQPIPFYSQRTRLRGGDCSLRPFYWDGGEQPGTGLPYAMGGYFNANAQVFNYRDPRAGPMPPNGYADWRAAQRQQVADWNAIHNLPLQHRLGEYPVNLIEQMPPAIRGCQTARGAWNGLLALVKLSVPVVFPVNNYVLQRLDLAMQDCQLPTGVVDGVKYTHHPHSRVFYRAAQLERALRLTAAGQPGVYAFNDAAANTDRDVMDERRYRDASQRVRANQLVMNAYQVVYPNPTPYRAIFPPTSTDLHAIPTVAGRIQALVDYVLEQTAWVMGLWLTDGRSAGTHIRQSLQTEYGLDHGIPNDHSGVFERCRHWVDLLGVPAGRFQVVPGGRGNGPNRLPASHIYFHALGPGGRIRHTNILRNLLVRCGVVVLPIFPPGLTADQRNAAVAAAEQLNKPRFWDAQLPNRLGWQNETVRTRRAFLAGCIDGDGTRELENDQYAISQEIAKAACVWWMCDLFRQLGFRTSQPIPNADGTKQIMQGIEHHFTDQRLLPIAILHKRTVGVGRRPEDPHTTCFSIEHADRQGNALLPGPVVSFTVQKPGRPCSHRLLLADGTITHNCDHDLTGLLESRVSLTLPQLTYYLYSILQGLYYLHRHKIIHRDIKGANILISNNGAVKIADFGLARIMTRGGYTNRVVTLWYRAPELLLGMSDYDAKIDMWAVGCLFAELLCKGAVLFPGNNSDLDQLHRIYEYCGTPDEKTWPAVTKLKYYAQFTPEKRERRLRQLFDSRLRSGSYGGLITNKAIDLLDRMLQLNPAERISAKDALDHDFFYEEGKGLRMMRREEHPKYGQNYHEYHSKRRRKNREEQMRHGAGGGGAGGGGGGGGVVGGGGGEREGERVGGGGGGGGAGVGRAGAAGASAAAVWAAGSVAGGVHRGPVTSAAGGGTASAPVAGSAAGGPVGGGGHQARGGTNAHPSRPAPGAGGYQNKPRG